MIQRDSSRTSHLGSSIISSCSGPVKGKMYPILLSCAKACRWAPPPTNNQAFAPQVPLCSAEQSRAEVAERNKRRRLLEVKAELRRGREEERRGEKQRREEEPTMVPRGRGREMQGGPLTLERYHRFFVDPWGTRLTIDHLNHVRTPARPHAVVCLCCVLFSLDCCFCFRCA